MQKIVQIIKSGKCVDEIQITLEDTTEDEDFILAAREIMRSDRKFMPEEFQSLLFDVLPLPVKRLSAFPPLSTIQLHRG